MLNADLILMDEERAPRVAKNVGLKVAGSIAMLERAARIGKIADLRSVYQSLLAQGMRFETDC
jgi:predicted nucleic acid-binding protein